VTGMVEELGDRAVPRCDVAQDGQVRNRLTGKPLAGSPAVLKHRMGHRPHPGFHAETTSQLGRATTLEAVDFGLCIAG
jgi:hypothetical protein